MAPTVVFHELRAVLICDVGTLRDGAAHQLAEANEMWLCPRELLVGEVIAHRALKGGVTGVPVEARGAGVALGRVACGLFVGSVGQLVYVLGAVFLG